MRQAIVTKKNDRVALQTPYDPDFIIALKNVITDRQWDGENKVWLVAEAEADRAIEIVGHYFEVVDGRDKDADEVEEAQLEAEIAQIKANQAWILKHEDHIIEAIQALDAQISRYSFRSKSSIKGRMCRNAALLGHSLNNAKMPVEQLTELHVRGLAAARRLLEECSIAQLTSRY